MEGIPGGLRRKQYCWRLLAPWPCALFEWTQPRVNSLSVALTGRHTLKSLNGTRTIQHT